MNGGSLPLPTPGYIDIEQCGSEIHMTSATGMIIRFSDKVEGFSRFSVHKQSDLNKGLLFLTSEQVGNFEAYTLGAERVGGLCQCNDETCTAGTKLYAPANTYRANFKVSDDQYLLSIIIENNTLSLTIINAKKTENFIKVQYSKL